MRPMKYLLLVSAASFGLMGCEAVSGDTDSNAQGAQRGNASATNLPDTTVRVTQDRQQISKGWHYLENPVRDVFKANEMNDWEAVDDCGGRAAHPVDFEIVFAIPRF